MKRHYSDYVHHCMRYYLSTPEYPFEFRRSCDRLAWISCDKALRSFDEENQNLLKAVYTSRVLTDGVEREAKKSGLYAKHIWSLVDRFENKVAIERGLI